MSRSEMSAGLVLTSIGYRGTPIRGLPFDDDAAVVPNDRGRVIDPRARRCGAATSQAGSSADRRASSEPTSPVPRRRCTPRRRLQRGTADRSRRTRPSALPRFVRGRKPAVIDAGGWKAIDRAEVRARSGRPSASQVHLGGRHDRAAARHPPRRCTGGCSRPCYASRAARPPPKDVRGVPRWRGRRCAPCAGRRRDSRTPDSS